MSLANPQHVARKHLPMACPADTCPEQHEEVQVQHTWSAGHWWPPDPSPTCAHCGAELAYV